MSYKTEREDFIARFVFEQVTAGRGAVLHMADNARTILKYARFLQRDAVAQCNGTYPYTNGTQPHAEWTVCAECESTVYASTCKGCKAIGTGRYCPSCRTAVKLVTLATAHGYQVLTSGDPRGYVVKLFPLGTTHEQMHQSIGAWGVPA